jgi:hypothetical protein
MFQISLNGKTRTNKCGILCNSFDHYKRRSGVDLVTMGGGTGVPPVNMRQMRVPHSKDYLGRGWLTA